MNAAEARALLESRLAALGAHHERVVAALLRDGALLAEEDDAEERSAMLQAEQLVERLEAHQRAELLHITGALRRVQDGSYRTCARCGSAIADGRLKAIPWADRCTSCAS